MMGDGIYKPSKMTSIILEILGATKRNLGPEPITLDPYVIAGQYEVCLNNGEVVARTIIAKLKPEYPDLNVEHKRGEGYKLSLKPVQKAPKELKCDKCRMRFESLSQMRDHMLQMHQGEP